MNYCFLLFQRGTFASEPAILVKRKSDANQVWSIEKLELKLIDMRELYEDLKVTLTICVDRNINYENKY